MRIEQYFLITDYSLWEVILNGDSPVPTRAARWWLKKEPPRSILTWEDLVSKFINEFFPPSRTTNLRNEISNFQHRFDESFHEAWDRYKDLLHACPHHVNQQTSAVTTAMIAILKQFQATLHPASIKAVEEICVTCGGAHLYYQCLAADGDTFLELQDNIQGYISAVINYNLVVPLSELEKIKRINEANMKAMQTQINNVKNELRNEMKNSIQASMSNQTNELKNMMASFFQMNTASTWGSRPLPSNTIANPKRELKAITTRSGIVLNGPSVPIPPPFINLKEDERVEETLTDQDLAEYTIKVPPPLLHINITLADALILIPKYQKMLKVLLSNKEKLLEMANTPLNENYSTVILKKLPEKLRDPGKFLILCGFSKLKCKALADLVESDTKYVYDNPFDSKKEKIKESKLLIDELDLPRSSDFLPSPKYDLFLFEVFSKVDALPSTDNEDKIFNPGILIKENLS
nr:hypothetical protein [Tanacetum cinerariifolium]